MTARRLHQTTWKRATLAGAVLCLGALSSLAQESWDGTLVQYGTMHEAIGQRQHDRIRDAAAQGVYASDAVGELTHPATSTHVHLIFEDDASGKEATGHVEQVGPAKGAVLKLPARE